MIFSRRSPLAAALLLAAIALFDRVGQWPGFVNANELSRLEAAAAMAFDGTPEISIEMKTLGSHEDFAERDGKIYSNKAPGLIFLWIPLVRFFALFLGRPSVMNLLTFGYLLRLATVTMAWLLAIFPLARLVERLGGDHRAAGGIFLALSFASPVGIYAGLGFSHTFAAALLLFVAERLVCIDPEQKAIAGRWAAAGALAAWAAMSEYPAALPAAFLFVFAFFSRPSWRGPLAAAAAGIATSLPLFLYNAVCFGGPLRLSSGFEGDPAFRSLASQGIFGIQRPVLSIAQGLLFSPSRGLLPLSPWISLAGLGALLLIGRRSSRFPMLALLTATLSLFLAISGYPNWHGGWATGPRYLVPVIPFLALGLVPFLFDSSEKTGGGPSVPAEMALLAGIGFSVVLVTIAATTFPNVPNRIFYPPAWQLDLARKGAWGKTLAGTRVPWIQFLSSTAAGLVIVDAGRHRFLQRAISFAFGAIVAVLLAGTISAR